MPTPNPKPTAPSGAEEPLEARLVALDGSLFVDKALILGRRGQFFAHSQAKVGSSFVTSVEGTLVHMTAERVIRFREEPSYPFPGGGFLLRCSPAIMWPRGMRDAVVTVRLVLDKDGEVAFGLDHLFEPDSICGIMSSLHEPQIPLPVKRLTAAEVPVGAMAEDHELSLGHPRQRQDQPVVPRRQGGATAEAETEAEDSGIDFDFSDIDMDDAYSFVTEALAETQEPQEPQEAQEPKRRRHG